MASTNVNKCANCGGELTFNPNIAAQKCAYCGSEFKTTNKQGKMVDDTCMVPFTIERNRAKKEILKWVITGNYVPANILSGSEIAAFEQCYVPVYMFKVTVLGTWAGYLKHKPGKDGVISKLYNKDHKPLVTGKVDEQLETICLANADYTSSFSPSQDYYDQYFARTGKFFTSDEVDHPVLEHLANYSMANKVIVEADKTLLDQGSPKEFKLGQNEAWETYAERQTAQKICAKLVNGMDKPEDKEVNIDVDYNITSATKMYLPFWMMFNYYNDEEYNVCMDGVTGAIIGEKIQDLSKRPSKKKFYRMCIIAGVALSMGLYIFRFYMPDGKDNFSHHNNPLFSPMGGFWWFVRMILLWGVLPKLASNYFYKNFEAMVNNNLLRKREMELQDLNAGRLQIESSGTGKKVSKPIVHNAAIAEDDEDFDEDDDLGDDNTAEPLDQEAEEKFQQVMRDYERGRYK